jgi:hypothetical protein
MARIMSFVTVVFILVPVACLAGKFILDYYNWHGFSIFRCFINFGFLVVWKRQPETLSIDNKKNFQQRFYRNLRT